jgi:dsDNA-specific endonuclease/ATPase MutS2
MSIRFKNILDSPCGIRFIFSKLNLSSPLSVSVLMDSRISLSISEISQNYKDLEEFCSLFNKGGTLYSIKDKIRLKLSLLKDIRNSLLRIKGGSTAGDIELFEIKLLCLVNNDIRLLLGERLINTVKLHCLEDIADLLDPQGSRIGSFYVYDEYSKELKDLRRALKDQDSYTGDNLSKLSELEDDIRDELTRKIKKRIDVVEESIYNLAKIDILIAKSEQLSDLSLSIPNISDLTTSFKGLFNPEIAEILSMKKSVYQPVDISFSCSEPLLITGANMGGKSLTLKTIALAQYLFQFGFGIPATESSIVPVSSVFLLSGDEQNQKRGLSSFAAEVKRVNKMLDAVSSGDLVLSLTDEPASTTNPTEGSALTSALIRVLTGKRVMSVLTTHYNISGNLCKKMRVKGFDNGRMNYELLVYSGDDAPMEALRVAETLCADKEWIRIAKEEFIKLKS